MNEYKAPEQAAEQAKKWNAASTACGVAAVMLALRAEDLSKYLPPHTGVDEQMLILAFNVLTLTWLAATAYCVMRGISLRRATGGEKY